MKVLIILIVLLSIDAKSADRKPAVVSPIPTDVIVLSK